MWIGRVGEVDRNDPEVESARCFALRAGDDGRNVEGEAICLSIS